MRKIIIYPDPILRKKAKEIEEINDDIKKLADEMASLMYENKGIGLAAPQVGESVRLITVDITGSRRENLMVLVNPVILSKEGEIEYEEGCLSLPGFRANIKRAKKIEVLAKDLSGEEKKISAEDILSVCIQHEIDHLDGILLLDYVGRLKRQLYENKVKKWKRRLKQRS